MPLDPARLLAQPPIVTHQRVMPRDVILYALGIGAEELPFVYEQGLVALPTMAVTLAYPGFFWRDPDYGVDWRRLLHGEVSVKLHAPLPTEAELVGETSFGPIIDKGAAKGAVVYTSRTIRDAAGTLIATVGNASFLRGDGGFGGSAEGQPRPHPLPDRAPDAVIALATSANQAALYRLSGDDNPLHIDPAVARAAGFERPILHGLATFGIAGRAVLSELCGNEPARLRRIDARFSSPVYPGETIRTDLWRDGEGRAAFRATVVERDIVVLTNGYVEHA